MDEQVQVEGALDEEHFNLASIESKSDQENWDLEALVEQICNEMAGGVNRTFVEQIVKEMANRYRNVRVKAFVPIFVKRDAVDLLRSS